MKVNINKIVTESINKVLSEKFNSSILRDLHKQSPNHSPYHGSNSFRYNDLRHDITTPEVISSRDGLDSMFFLDKITDDMIETVGTERELANQGYVMDGNKLTDMDGNRRYAMVLRDGKYVVFKNDENTINKMKELSTQAGEQYKQRETNKRNDGKDSYQWSTKDRGTAYHDWKHTAPLWDNEEFRNRRDVDVPKDWRERETWLGNQMKKAKNSYKKKGSR